VLATLNRDDFAPGEADHARLNTGDRPGTHWLPAECDVSIRPGWFYHAAEDERVKSATNWLISTSVVGRGASFLVNLPPDRRGQIHPRDARNLVEFNRRIEQIFAQNLALAATDVVGPMRGRDEASRSRSGEWRSGIVLGDGRRADHAGDSVGVPRAGTLQRDRPARASAAGQRVSAFAVDAWADGQWQEIGRGTSIGARRLLRTADIETARVRLRITDAPACQQSRSWGCGTSIGRYDNESAG